MKMILISIRDNAVEAFQPISTVRARGEALRGFMDLVNNPNNAQLHQHPEDFDLYELGELDDQTGKITAREQPERLMRGIDAKKGS